MIRLPRLPAPPRLPCACAPITPRDDPALARGWLIETALLRIRWGAAGAIALQPALFHAIPRVPLLLIALGLVLGNAALARLCARGLVPGHLRAMQRWATALEWAALIGVVGLWWADPASKVPVVLTIPVLAAGARWRLPGIGGAAASVAVALMALVGWQALARGTLAPREAAILFGTWVVLLALPASVAGALAWAGAAAWRWEAARDWHERAALRRYTSGLSPRQWEVLVLLARPELTYEAIAARLHLEPESVREYVKRIAAKWEITGGRAAVVATARARGLLDPLEDTAPPDAA